jgi:CBS domain-containing protein
MITTSKPFSTLTAADLMSREVVLIPKELSLRAAARLLSRNQISGAPVVDAEGRCIGVVSATDFVRWAEKDNEAATIATADTDCHCAWQVVEPERLPVDQVNRYMTCDPIMVSPQTPIRELARLMLDAHIHRVIVKDELRRPVGIVSSMDILAAVANASSAMAPTGSSRVDAAADGSITPWPKGPAESNSQCY